MKGGLTFIGWYMLAVLLLALLLASCSHKTYESVVRDTVTVVKTDSVLVTMRDVDVTVPVPQITLEQWVPIDTISVLDNGLYVSVVEVIGGQIHHQLKPVEGATLPATVTVADTTHISSTTTHESHHEKETVTIEPKESWFDRVKKDIGSWMLYTVAVVALILGAGMILKSKIKPP